MSDPIINVENIAVSYNNGIPALRDVDFELHPGSICALVGMNGAGKSTLFKTLMGFISPFSGSLKLAGLSVKDALKAGHVAYVPQSEDMDWDFPVLVRDVVMMGRYGAMGFLRIPSRSDHDAVEQALKRVNLFDYKDRPIGALSGGQKKRVFLARALAQIIGSETPKIILLDEPFTGVDVQTENQIIDVMRGLRDEGHLMLVATHNLGSVPDYCDHVVLMNKTIIAAGPLETTFTQDNLAMAFGGMLRQIHLEGDDLHDDEDPRSVMVITDDERPLVFYGDPAQKKIVKRKAQKEK